MDENNVMESVRIVTTAIGALVLVGAVTFCVAVILGVI